MVRCEWANNSFEEYEKYHDIEWGAPVHDDNVLFEFLILEGAQAGLSWSTVLNKRDGYKKAFANFNVKKVASFSETEIELLILDSGIIRNKLKIRTKVT